MRIRRCCAQCGHSFAYEKGRGRLRKYCSAKCRSNAQRTDVTARVLFGAVCKHCGESFIGTASQIGVGNQRDGSRSFCSSECRQGHIAQNRGPFICEHCGDTYTKRRGRRRGQGERFCGRECAFLWLRTPDGKREWEIRNAERLLIQSVRMMHREHCKAGYSLALMPCSVCGQPSANEVCSIQCRTVAGYDRNGKVHACTVCGVQWCNLYGKTRRSQCSDECADAVRRAWKKRGKSLRRARRRISGETVLRERVFRRDRWMCRGCGCRTPRSLMGLCEDSAPELDHIVPLSKGGAHTYENTQLLCRVCNILKSDMDMDQFMSMYFDADESATTRSVPTQEPTAWRSRALSQARL